MTVEKPPEYLCATRTCRSGRSHGLAGQLTTLARTLLDKHSLVSVFPCTTREGPPEIVLYFAAC